MPQNDASTAPNVDTRKLVLEAMATLVNVKRIAADRLLRPAGIPDSLIKRFLKGRDETTGEPLTKRQAGALILDELEREDKEGAVVRKLLEIAAGWTAFDLAQDEYKARAVVQKARELAGTLAEADAREKAEQERGARERAERHKIEHEAMQRRESALLLAQFDQAALDGEDPQKRGYLYRTYCIACFSCTGYPWFAHFSATLELSRSTEHSNWRVGIILLNADGARVQARGVLKKELLSHLRSKRTIRRSKHAGLNGDGRGQIKDLVSIRARPAAVEDRAVPGHWEGDLPAGSKNSYIATLVERHTRFVMLAKVANKDTQTVISALIKQAKKLPDELYKSLTWDRGKELTDHRRFTLATNIDVYFCDPQSPWQRGSNENTNGLLRQYFPKGTDLSGHSQAYLNKVARQLNERPRETLLFETPAERFNACVASIG